MKKIVLILFAFSFFTLLHAQDSLSISQPEKRNRLLQFDFSFGGNIDLTHRTTANLTSLLTERKKVIPVYDMRISFFPINRWGIYSNFRISIPQKEQNGVYPELYQSLETDYFIKEDYYPTSNNDVAVNAYISLGPVYRIIQKKWGIHSRIGMGLNEVVIQQRQAILKKKGSNEMYNLYMDCTNLNASKMMLGLECGINIYYELRKHCRLFMDMAYYHPLQSAESEYIKIDMYTNEVVEKKSYRLSTLGRNLNISIGIGIPVFRNKKTSTGHHETNTNQRSLIPPIR